MYFIIEIKIINRLWLCINTISNKKHSCKLRMFLMDSNNFKTLKHVNKTYK
jgi:hypothetical protein